MKTKNLFIIFLLLILGSTISCINTDSSSNIIPSSTAVVTSRTTISNISNDFTKGIIQIYENDDLLGSGVAVGDGNLILTAINYEHYSPGALKVQVPGQGTFDAVVQAIDPRTSLTLLKMPDTTLPAARLGDSSIIKPGQNVIVCDWNTKTQEFQEVPMLVGETTSDLQFHLNWPIKDLFQYPQMNSGAAVFSESGEVTGIGGVTPGFLHFPLGYAVNINSAKDLISGSTEQQPWYKGPILLFRLYPGDQSSSTSWGFPQNYPEVAPAIEQVLNKLGIPITGDTLPENIYQVKESGTIIVAVFARPVQLYNGKEVIGTAKWTGIQKLDFDREFTRLYYGNRTYFIDGEYEIDADITLPAWY